MIDDTTAWNDHRGRVLDQVGEYRVIDCSTCRFNHVVPLPSEQKLRSVYEREYYEDEKPRFIERAEQDQKWWSLVYGDRFDSFEEFLEANRRQFLDVGCGPGYFLLEGKKRGWQGFGIEPSVRAASHAKNLGLEVVQGFFDRAEAEAFLGTMDVVYLAEVLEHVSDPAKILSLAREILNPGGLLAVVVPNDYNPVQQALRKVAGFEPWWVAPPHHLNFFDFDSLEALFARIGFEVVMKEATFPIDLFLMMGDNYVGDDNLGRACHEKRMRLEERFFSAGANETKRKLYRAFAQAGLGREVFMLGRRVD